MSRTDTLCNQNFLDAGDRVLVPDRRDSGDLKKNFDTREGTYRLMNLSEYSRPNRVSYQPQGQTPPHVRVSIVSPADAGGGDRICFNHGSEVYIYAYNGIKKAADLTKPMDKKVYRSMNPTCHHFNEFTACTDSIPLLIGFSTGQIKLIDPVKKELCKPFNDERLIDKSRVTCLRWVPQKRSMFIVGHASGQLFVYNEQLPCGTTLPHYQPLQVGNGFQVSACKTKTTRNPLSRWVLGNGAAVNDFEFSPNGTHLAIVTQDGLLRVFHYEAMEIQGVARSYFGGLLCVNWSGDGKLIAVGGEDDLVTIWSVEQKRVIARGQGHRSWVSAVAFDWEVDSYYRIGSVGHDTQLCLWELPEDALVPIIQPKEKWRNDPLQLVGTAACPRMEDCPLLEPLIHKKIAHERLTTLIFRKDCFLTACQDGYVYTWARPIKQ